MADYQAIKALSRDIANGDAVSEHVATVYIELPVTCSVVCAGPGPTRIFFPYRYLHPKQDEAITLEEFAGTIWIWDLKVLHRFTALYIERFLTSIQQTKKKHLGQKPKVLDS